MKSHHALETFIVFFDTLLAAMWVAMGCVVALNTLPLDRAVDGASVPASFDVAMPAAQAADASASFVVATN